MVVILPPAIRQRGCGTRHTNARIGNRVPQNGVSEVRRMVADGRQPRCLTSARPPRSATLTNVSATTEDDPVRNDVAAEPVWPRDVLERKNDRVCTRAEHAGLGI